MDNVTLVKMSQEKRDINLQRRQAMRRKGFVWEQSGVSMNILVPFSAL